MPKRELKTKEAGNDNGEIFFSWEFPEYFKYERSKLWYLGMGILGGILLIYCLFAKNFLFALIVIMVGIIIFLYEAKEPLNVSFSITEDGLELGRNFYPWKDLKNFWIIYEPPKIKTLYFIFKNAWRPRLNIPLLDQNPLKIREKLLEYLDEDLEKEEEPISDSFGRFLKL